MSSNATVRQLVLDRFRDSGLEPVTVEVKSFPGETIVVVEVDREHDLAVDIARELDDKIESGFVTVRQAPSRKRSPREQVSSVHDERIPRLIELMNARARTSEAQPSLRYVADVAERKALAVSPRHHLVFGRRGVGKTALLLEARKHLEKEGALTLWVNMHPLREFKKEAAFLTIALRICDLGIGALRKESSNGTLSLLNTVRASLGEALAESDKKRPRVCNVHPAIATRDRSPLCGDGAIALYFPR